MTEPSPQPLSDPPLAVPADGALRARLVERAAGMMAHRDPEVLLRREELLALAGDLLGSEAASPDYLGYAAIVLNNAFWHDRYRQVDYPRRLLLLPRCLEGMDQAFKAEADTPLSRLVARARELGYTIKVADGTPLAVRLLAEERMDAILGISCLDSLDKAFDKVHLLGVPALAVPLLADGCKETATDLELARTYLEALDPAAAAAPPRYLSLLRRVWELFKPPALQHYMGEPEGEVSGRLTGPGALATDWIARGGKRFRPFITAAVYQALTDRDELPPAVALAAFAVEVFHKASLVHDDIEDHDRTRYGLPTLHEEQGLEIALNVGDYLLGLGYRLIGRTEDHVGPQMVADQLRLLSRTHMGLARGQGMELAWRVGARGDLEVDEAVRIYALKTAPAFEAALGLGLILGGAGAAHRQAVRRWSRYLGVAFQVLNDLDGWEGDLGGDRPTIMPALAALTGLEGNWRERPAAEIRADFERLGVFGRAHDLVARCRARAEKAAASVEPPALADLLQSLLAMVLDRERRRP